MSFILAPCRSYGQPSGAGVEEEAVLEPTRDDQEIIARIAALDIDKATLTCCVRVPGGGLARRRVQGVSEHSNDDPLVAADG